MADDNSPCPGSFQDGIHVYPLRVYYEDTDAAGIVYYANYLKFAERARTEMMHLLDVGYRDLVAQHSIAFAVRRVEVDFLAPAKLDDILEVRTSVTEAAGASVTADQVIHRSGDEITRLRVRLACLGPDGRLLRLPPMLRTALENVIRE